MVKRSGYSQPSADELHDLDGLAEAALEISNTFMSEENALHDKNAPYVADVPPALLAVASQRSAGACACGWAPMPR